VLTRRGRRRRRGVWVRRQQPWARPSASAHAAASAAHPPPPPRPLLCPRQLRWRHRPHRALCRHPSHTRRRPRSRPNPQFRPSQRPPRTHSDSDECVRDFVSRPHLHHLFSSHDFCIFGCGGVSCGGGKTLTSAAAVLGTVTHACVALGSPPPRALVRLVSLTSLGDAGAFFYSPRRRWLTGRRQRVAGTLPRRTPR
jgi:hypothetical protein